MIEQTVTSTYPLFYIDTFAIYAPTPKPHRSIYHRLNHSLGHVYFFIEARLDDCVLFSNESFLCLSGISKKIYDLSASEKGPRQHTFRYFYIFDLHRCFLPFKFHIVNYVGQFAADSPTH